MIGSWQPAHRMALLGWIRVGAAEERGLKRAGDCGRPAVMEGTEIEISPLPKSSSAVSDDDTAMVGNPEKEMPGDGGRGDPGGETQMAGGETAIVGVGGVPTVIVGVGGELAPTRIIGGTGPGILIGDGLAGSLTGAMLVWTMLGSFGGGPTPNTGGLGGAPGTTDGVWRFSGLCDRGACLTGLVDVRGGTTPPMLTPAIREASSSEFSSCTGDGPRLIGPMRPTGDGPRSRLRAADTPTGG